MKIIVIGGGLAGLTTALTASKRCEVILLEKEPILGGNSAKASSGINANSDLQKRMGIRDKSFYNDTKRSSKRQSKYSDRLMKRLVKDSEKAIIWLDKNGVKLNDVKLLGGHTVPRTHRSSRQIHIGSYIVAKLVDKVNKNNNIEVITGAKVRKIFVEDGINRVKYNDKTIYGDKIVITTGGFGYNRSMITKYRPDLKGLSTTNGKWTTGSGIEFADSIGAKLIDMKKIQVHPTGFIDKKNRYSKTKVLAAELLRGIGGVLLNKKGERFCNELGTRDYIVREMNKQKDNTFLLVIPVESHKDAKRMIDHYVSKGLLKKRTIEKIVRDYRVNGLTKTIEEYGQTERYGKKVFPKPLKNTFFIGEVTPCVHYCMGGIQVNEKAQAIGRNGEVIKGIFAVGEVTGGVHGNNRLGGNSLLECVVFGRIAGKYASKSSDKKSSGMDRILNKAKKSSGMDRILNKAKKSKSVDRVIDSVELAKHNKKTSGWMVLYGKVYDVTPLIKSHPGGPKAIMDNLGRDGTKTFAGIHDKAILSQMDCIGRFKK